MFSATDPRYTLVAAHGAAALGRFDPAELMRLHDIEPSESGRLGKTWFSRGQNLIIAYTEAEAGLALHRPAQRDEYAVLIPDRTTEVEISANDDVQTVGGSTLAFVPPGHSTIRASKPGRLVRVFTNAALDLAKKCSNAERFTSGHGRVAAPVPWPTPADGWRIRSYSLDIEPKPGRFGRIWRCTTIMINYLDPSDGPRDPTKLSPHHHEDFEQCSLALGGEFVHHLRWPWTPNRLEWRADQHELCGSPSIAIIPPPCIHTTEACGSGPNQLVDIFCPPRRDFSEKQSWVLNASDYPIGP